jgi:hypothetical protein
MTETSGWLVAADADLDAIRRCLIDPPRAADLVQRVATMLQFLTQGHDLVPIPSASLARFGAECFGWRLWVRSCPARTSAHVAWGSGDGKWREAWIAGGSEANAT